MALPLRGEFIIVQLDPLETLRPLLDDPEVVRACEALRLQTKKYLVCVTKRMRISVFGALHPLEVAMISRGLVSGPDEHAIQEMSLPILPNTSHPQGRTPLICDPPLPWTDCYLQTLTLTSIRIKFSDPTARQYNIYYLNPPKQAGTITLLSEDDNEWRDRLMIKGITDADSGGVKLEPLTFRDPDSSADDVNVFDSRPEKSLQPKDTRAAQRASVHSLYAEALSDMEIPVYECNITPVVDFSMDLDALKDDQMANPWDFFVEVDVIERIHKSYNARMQAKRSGRTTPEVPNFDAMLNHEEDFKEKTENPDFMAAKKSTEGSDSSTILAVDGSLDKTHRHNSLASKLAKGIFKVARLPLKVLNCGTGFS